MQEVQGLLCDGVVQARQALHSRRNFKHCRVCVHHFRTVERQQVQFTNMYKHIEYTRWPMLAGFALGWLVGGPTKAVAMLGCNYLGSQIPLRLLTLLNGLGAGVERGILVKDCRALERLPMIDTVVFDKTDTLTLDQQQVVQIHVCVDFA